MIVWIFIGKQVCVGAYIASYVILTAAHCLAPSGISVGAVQDSTGAKSTSIILSRDWPTNQYTINDFAFIVVNQPQSHTLRVSPTATANDGRPIKLPVYNQTMFGHLLRSQHNLDLLYYSVPIYDGTSGAPIQDENTQEVIGVNSVYAYDGGAGPRITTRILAEYGITNSVLPIASPTPIKKKYTIRVPLT